jgi:hypothetical protein
MRLSFERESGITFTSNFTFNFIFTGTTNGLGHSTPPFRAIKGEIAHNMSFGPTV